MARRTGIAEAAAELEAAGEALAAAGPASEDRYSVALERYHGARSSRFRRRAPAGVLDDLGLPSRLLELPTASLSGGQRARSSLAALPARAPRSPPPRRADERSRLRWSRSSRGLPFEATGRSGRRESRPGLPGADRHRRGGHRRGVASGHDIRRGFCRLRRGQGDGPAPRRGGVPGLRGRAGPVTWPERSQREWATRGASKERRNPKDGDKAQRDFRLNRTEKQASKVRITEKALARLAPVEKPWEAWDLHLDLTMARRSGDVVARLSGAVVHRGEWKLGPLDLEVRWADRLAIVGPNGSGKSTLLAALLGRVVLTSGALLDRPFGRRG